MPISTVAAFWTVSILFILTPGADWAYAISSGLRSRSVVPAISGMLSGHLAAVVVVSAGLGLLVTGNPVVLGVLTGAGATYVVWLGLGMIRDPGDGPCVDDDEVGAHGPEVGGSIVGQYSRGFGVSLLNPKVILLLGALLPPFADPASPWPVPAQMLVLGGVHLVGCAVVYSVVGILAVAVLRSRPGAARWVTRTSGVVLVLVGAALLGRQCMAWL